MLSQYHEALIRQRPGILESQTAFWKMVLRYAENQRVRPDFKYQRKYTMPHTQELKEVAELAKRFADGETEDWEWSTFEAVPAEASAVEQLRQEVLAVATQFPPRTVNEWCAPEGLNALRAIANRVLGVEEDSGVIVKDSNGTRLSNGDSVTLIKDLPVKGANVTLKRGTTIRNIRLTFNEEEVECNADKVKGLVLRTEFLKKA
jgi:protein PhnA